MYDICDHNLRAYKGNYFNIFLNLESINIVSRFKKQSCAIYKFIQFERCVNKGLKRVIVNTDGLQLLY